jgi:hypothetical protein
LARLSKASTTQAGSSGGNQKGTGNHGFLYSNGTYTTIDDPASAAGLTLAWDINNWGQIVGYYGAILSGAHGFLATPAPPSAAPLHPSIISQIAALSLLGLLAWRRKRQGNF